MENINPARIEHYFTPEVCVGSECNNACLFCSVGSPTAFKWKTLDEIKEEMKVLRQVANNVKFTGGEVTIRKDLAEMISFAKSLGFQKIIVETNGRMFYYEDFTKKIFEAGATDFLISIHGHKPEIHDALTRIPGSFEQTVEGLKNLAKYYKGGVGVNVVITRPNYKYLPEIVSFLSTVPVKHITLSFITVCGAAARNRSIVPKKSEVIPYVKKAIDGLKNQMVSLNHFPVCLLAGYEKYARFMKVPIRTQIKNPNYIITLESQLAKVMTKGEKCKQCKYDNLCEGLWKEYVNLYGFDEFMPVPGRKLQNIEEFEAELRGM